MNKVESEIIRVLLSFKETEQKAREFKKPEKATCIQAKIDGYRMGLKTCMNPALVDGIFSRVGY